MDLQQNGTWGQFWMFLALVQVLPTLVTVLERGGMMSVVVIIKVASKKNQTRNRDEILSFSIR